MQTCILERKHEWLRRKAWKAEPVARLSAGWLFPPKDGCGPHIEEQTKSRGLEAWLGEETNHGGQNGAELMDGAAANLEWEIFGDCELMGNF